MCKGYKLSDNSEKKIEVKKKVVAKKKSLASSGVSSKKKVSDSKISEVFILPAIVDITYVYDLHKHLSEVAKIKIKTFTLDSSKVEKITTPAIQILLAFFKKLEEKKVKYSLINITEAFEASFNDIGLGNKLEEWVK